MGSGLRLLPLMGGLAAGFGLATLMIKPLTAKLARLAGPVLVSA